MNILLTSVGRRTYMVSYFKDALKGIGKVHAANSHKTHAMNMADQWVITPYIHTAGYVDFLLSYCIDNQINAIISFFDIDLPVLSRNTSRFEANGIRVIVSSTECVRICYDKWLTFEFLRSNGLNTPETFLNIRDCQDALAQGKIQFPLITKPRCGMGSIGVFQADDQSELEVLYNKTQKSIRNSYLKFGSNFEPESSVIIQEKLFGDEFGLDIFNDLAGNYLTCIPIKWHSFRAGETECAEILNQPEMADLGKTLSQKLRHIANLDVDCFKVGELYYVLELNCRFGGQYPFCHLAGADFPKAIVNMLANQEVPTELLTARAGTIGCKDLNPVIVI